MRRALEVWSRDPWHRALILVVLGSLVLNATGILWGLPGYGWAGDELTPGDIIPAVEQHFSNGWWSKWPPLQHYVLALAYSPFLLLASFKIINLYTPYWYVALLIVGRVVSVAAGAATLVAIFIVGARVFSKRAGLFAAAGLALVAPFVYYAKTANIDGPWLFWFALSLVFYMRLLDQTTSRDLVLFAVFAMLCICAKDQAYGLYLAAPVLIVSELSRRNRQVGVAHPLRSALLRGGLDEAATAAIAVFMVCHNLFFNFDGFLKHVHYITGAGSEGYRMFAPTLAGRFQLLALTARLDRLSLGWPLLVLSIAGFAIACATPSMRRATLWLAVMAVTYYLGFINVILYNYDRFLFPILAIQALFVGVAADRLLELRLKPAAAVLAAAFLYTTFYASTVDALMLRDSRYVAEQWIRAHVRAGDAIATAFPIAYQPRLDGIKAVNVETIDELQRSMPSLYILNADYARAIDPQSAPGQFVTGLQRGTVGYALAGRYRSPNPWPWLPGGHSDLVGPRLDTNVSSMLRYVNPTMEIYQRVDGTR